MVERGRDYIALPLPEFSYRRGLRTGIDLGGKAHLTGAEASARFAMVDHGRVALAWTAGLALGYEPITNNTTDLVYARALPRLVAELRPGGSGQGPTWIATAVPSLTFTGPVTMFAGIAGAARFIVRPGAALSGRAAVRAGLVDVRSGMRDDRRGETDASVCSEPARTVHRALPAAVAEAGHDPLDGRRVPR